jgi:hypothetical protein
LSARADADRASVQVRARPTPRSALAFQVLGCVILAGCRAPGGAPRSETRGLTITSAERTLELTARIREQEQTSKVGAGRTRSEEQIFEETVGIELEGSVYHPNFLEFTLAGLLGVTQQDFEDEFDGRKRTSSDDGDIYEFDFEGDFLKKKPTPGSVFASRHRSLQPRPFLSSLETTTTNYGVVWQLVDPKTPTSLQFNHTEVELDPLDDLEEPGLQRNTTFRFDTAYRFSEHNTLSFTYDYRSIEEEPFGLAYDSDEFTLRHRLAFGDRHQHGLDSELDYFDQRGSFDIRRTRLREILRFTHTEALKSWYRFEFTDRNQGNLSGVPPIGERSYLVSGTLEHQWYDSLLSQLFAFAQWQDFDSGLDITRYGLQPSVNYRKHNPWGVLLADYRFRIQREDRTGGLLTNEVIDERATFNDPQPVVLANINVRINSIFMTDTLQTTMYLSGRDYRVQRIGDQVEIERVPTGRIADGQTVLIDYIYEFGGDFTLDTLSHDFSIRQNFKFGLAPYYRIRYQDQDLDPKDALGITPEDITANMFGAEFDRGPVRLTAEYEDHDSTIVPFTAVRLSANLKHRFESGGTGLLRARWSDVSRFGEFARSTRFLAVETRYRHRIDRHLTFEGAVLYRTEDDSASGEDEGVDVDLALEWLIRDTELRVTYEYGQYEDEFAENDNSTLFVQFRRRF